MITLNIKPLSVNQAWQGRRFKTPKYKKYAEDVTKLLPAKIDIPDGLLVVRYDFYFSNKASDWDNPIKPIQDIICAKYGINDNRIYKAIIEKHIVTKGEDRIEFEFGEYEED